MGSTEMNILRDLCGQDELLFQLTRELLSVEKRHKSMLRRAGLFDAVEQAFHRNFYVDEEDAVSRARQRRDAIGTARARVTEDGLRPPAQTVMEFSAPEDEAR